MQMDGCILYICPDRYLSIYLYMYTYASVANLPPLRDLIQLERVPRSLLFAEDDDAVGRVKRKKNQPKMQSAWTGRRWIQLHWTSIAGPLLLSLSFFTRLSGQRGKAAV